MIAIRSNYDFDIMFAKRKSGYILFFMGLWYFFRSVRGR